MFEAVAGALTRARKRAKKRDDKIIGEIRYQSDRQLLLSGRRAAFEVQNRTHIRSLADVEFGVFSQWGEDGIIEWLCHQLPDMPRRFIEFGVSDYKESNTRFLLQNRGWSGLVMDGNDGYMQALRRDAMYWRNDLEAHGAFITAENINGLIRGHGFAGDLGILSVDIDGNDYWVLKAIDCVNPAVIICEINGVFGDLHAITVPYDPAFQRLEAHYSGQYFGASIGAITSLAGAKGYRLIGTATSGVNAFYVREDLADRILSRIDEVVVWPTLHRDSRNSSGQLDFVRGAARADLIKDQIVVEIATGREATLGSLFPLYSPRIQDQLMAVRA